MKVYFIFSFFLIFIWNSCKTPANQFIITDNGVFSKNNKVTQFSISQFKFDHSNLNDIRPNNHEELMRYCCNIKPYHNEMKDVLFKDTANYSWVLCKLDTSLVSNSSLNFQQKIDFIKQMEQKNSGLILTNFKIPFQIEKGFTYQIFGLPDLDGSFYFCFDSSNKLIVQYQGPGPF